MKETAEVVIIGSGIVGASAAHFLAKKGWKDIVVIDQGPLFEAGFSTGGSTSHAPGLVFELNASKTICQLAQWSVETYRSLSFEDQPCFYSVGSFEIAYSSERLEELKIKWGRAHAWGLKAELLTREQTLQRVPLLNPSQIFGSLSVPSDGVAKALRAVQALAWASRGNVEFISNTEVLGIETAKEQQRKQICGVTTSRGKIKTSRVLVCAGIWGPRIGKMVEVPIPLVPVQHHYVRTAPVKELTNQTAEVVYPILRNQDHGLYFRQYYDTIGIGSYSHEPVLVDPDLIGENAKRPLKQEDFHKAFANACHLLPCLEGAKFAESFNGLFSFTLDGNPLVGESDEVKGFWMAEGVWVTHGPGVGRVVAELMNGELPKVDLRELDANRFDRHALSPSYARVRGAQQFREVYDIIHPLQQIEDPRPLRVSPFYSRQKELGAVFFESNGWERPQWYESNSSLPKDESWPVREGWNARYWSPIIGQEHKATREAVALFDLSAFSKFEVSGPGALNYLQNISANQINQKVNKIVYTAMLNSAGGIMCDLTITRRSENRFWVVTGGGVGTHDRGWMLKQLRQDQNHHSVQFTDLTSSFCCLGVWGPSARALLQSVSESDFSNEAFPLFTAKEIFIGYVPALALRMSYVGELGWEIYVPAEYGAHLWDLLWQAGQCFGVIAAGGGAFDSLRLEKGYRLWGADIHSEYNPYEAGLGFAVKLENRDFIGKSALVALGKGSSRRKLSCMIIEDEKIILLGKEPVFLPARKESTSPISAGNAIGYVTSANYGYTVGKSIAYAYLPSEYAQIGLELEVAYLGQRYRAYVAPEPLYDPSHARMKR